MVCPGCHFEDKTFKRASDLKFHYEKCHPKGSLPDGAFTEANGFWLALYPADYLRVIKPTPRVSELARKTRAAVITMLGASTCQRLKSKNDWYDGWDKEREGYKPAEKGVSPDLPAYHPTPLQQIKSAVTTVRHTTPQPTTERERSKSMSRTRSPSPALSDSSAISSFIGKSPPFRPDYKDDIEVAETSSSPEITVIKISLLPDDCKVYLKEGDLSYKAVLSNTIFGCPRAMQALARRMATLSLEPQDLIADTRLTPCHNQAKRGQVMTVLGIDPKFIVSIMMTPPLFEPPTKRSRMEELSEMTTSQRAVNLMRRGCFPLFQPARREWGEDDKVELKAGEVSLTWPPQGWKELSGDLKLLQWEMAAYKLAEATRPVQVLQMPGSELLDRFNFLALPGTSCHHVPRAHKETAKARYHIYERLREMANGESTEDSDIKWLQILECGAMMRDTSEDALLDLLESVPLRLKDTA